MIHLQVFNKKKETRDLIMMLPASLSLCGYAASLSPWFRTTSLFFLKRVRVERGRHLAPPNPSTIKYFTHLQQLGCILARPVSVLLELKLLMHPIPTN